MQKLLFLILWALPFSMAAQPGDNVIRWQENLKLTWEDYKGKPDPATDAAASTATYLGIEYSFENNKVGFKITNSFSLSRSWVRHKTDHVLSHEQGHFDIAEIFARKLNREMKSYTFNAGTYKTDLRTIYENVLRQKEEMQNAYDAETDHSINKEKQAEWLKKIAQFLNEYAGHAVYL